MDEPDDRCALVRQGHGLKAGTHPILAQRESICCVLVRSIVVW